MEFELYNPTFEKGDCIVRTLTKLLNKDLNIIKEELNELAKELNYDNYREIEIFEKYLENNNYKKIMLEERQVKDLKLIKGKYAVFCYNKKDYYHMFSVIDNIVYDKDRKCFDLYTISIYKFN